MNPQKRTGMETSNKQLWIKIQGPRNDRVVIKPFHFGVHYFDTYSDGFKPWLSPNPYMLCYVQISSINCEQLKITWNMVRVSARGPCPTATHSPGPRIRVPERIAGAGRAMGRSSCPSGSVPEMCPRRSSSVKPHKIRLLNHWCKMGTQF